jgi:hypothetical protein
MPCTRTIERFGDVVVHPILGGLHHRYEQVGKLNRKLSPIIREDEVCLVPSVLWPSIGPQPGIPILSGVSPGTE